nr:MAG TPA: hypothetical protein [Caudoviricetes sp.]
MEKTYIQDVNLAFVAFHSLKFTANFRKSKPLTFRRL